MFAFADKITAIRVSYSIFEFPIKIEAKSYNPILVLLISHSRFQSRFFCYIPNSIPYSLKYSKDYAP